MHLRGGEVEMMTDKEWNQQKRWATSPAKKLYEEAAKNRELLVELFRGLLASHPPLGTAINYEMLVDRSGSPPAKANAPGHGHHVPGVWDESNRSPLGGQVCSWCLTWERVKEWVGPIPAPALEKR